MLKVFYVVGFLFYHYILYAQDNSDSVALTKIFKIIAGNNTDTISNVDLESIRNLVYQIQNKGFDLEENHQDFEGALTETNKALQIWIRIKDTINEANNLKYKGVLEGRLKHYDLGEKDIWKAIHFFRDKNYFDGIAVSYFDLSTVYELENRMDSALVYSDSALEYWKSKNNIPRIIISNNQLMNLYCKVNKYDDAVYIQKQSEKIVFSRNLHWRPLIDFYYLSSKIYERKSNRKKFRRYKNLYNNEIAKLKKRNLFVKSNYSLK